MKSLKNILKLALACTVISLFGCKEDKVAVTQPPPLYTQPKPVSFTETFDKVGDLASRGWIFRNLSNPVGQSGWRQGRYEAINAPNSKFPDGFIGYPAFKATETPNDFVSCDLQAVNFTGQISAWLISPKMVIKNGDIIEFYTRTVNDLAYNFSVKDRLQVRANITDGTDNVGNSDNSMGSFDKLLLEINPNYVNNSGTVAGGFPYQAWTKYTITIAGLSAPVANGRIAFRYMGKDVGVDGPNYGGVCGIDEFSYKSL